MSSQRVSLFLLAFCSMPIVSFGGTLRYDLPELLGEHSYDGTTYLGGLAHVDTSFGFGTVQQARLVISGSVQPGKARGDGVIREALEFELEPFVQAVASFRGASVQLPVTPTIGSFTIDEIYPNPFVPKTTPLPNPGGYPPISFSVGLGLNFTISTNIPPNIDPGSPFNDATDGIIIDEPIIANITTAYIEFQGAAIVPEPSSVTIAIAACMFGLTARFRHSKGHRSHMSA